MGLHHNQRYWITVSLWKCADFLCSPHEKKKVVRAPAGANRDLASWDFSPADFDEVANTAWAYATWRTQLLPDNRRVRAWLRFRKLSLFSKTFSGRACETHPCLSLMIILKLICVIFSLGFPCVTTCYPSAWPEPFRRVSTMKLRRGWGAEPMPSSRLLRQVPTAVGHCWSRHPQIKRQTS